MLIDEGATPCILLIDNGSVKADATLVLRRLAEKLSRRCECTVDAVSLRHADKIKSSELNEVPAQVFAQYMQGKLADGQRNFIIIPLFFGLSKAVTSFVPQQLELLIAEFGQFKVDIGEVLYPLPAGDHQLVEIIHENINVAMRASDSELSDVILVDHGSPTPRITRVREHVAGGLQGLLGSHIHLSQAVMERREGEEYDFNGPLLEHCLSQMAQQGKKGAIVSMMFLLPGRHAGACGDVEQICDRVRQQYPRFEIHVTPLVSENEKLIALLSKRLTTVLESRHY